MTWPNSQTSQNAGINKISIKWTGEPEAYFTVKDKLLYQKGIYMLEKRYKDCIALKGNNVDE